MADESGEVLEISFRDEIEGVGWARVSHALTLLSEISDGAYRLYCLLLMYAQQKAVAWPSERILAEELGVHRTTVSRRFTELEKVRLVARKRRVAASTLTWIEPLQKCTALVPVVAKMHTRRSKNATTDVAKMLRKEEQRKKNNQQQQASGGVVVFSQSLQIGLEELGMSEEGVQKL